MNIPPKLEAFVAQANAHEWPVIRSFEFGEHQRDVLYRLDRLTDELSLDRKRAAAWAIVQAIAWASGSDYAAQHYQTARWLLASR